jgi:uncharacterized protein YggE
MKRTVALLLFAAVAGVYLFGGRAPQQRAAVAADVPATTNGVVVDGLGKVSGTPDVLRVVLGVTVQRSDVSAALAAANSRQAALTTALKRDGVADKDLQTADVQVGSTYDNRGKPNGYQVTETLTAKLRDLGKAGKTIGDAVTAGGSEAVLQGLSFALEDNARLLAQARDAAFADAQAKAERYAQLARRTLGAVELVTESTSTSQPVPIAAPLAYATADKAAVPVSPGTSDVSVSVTVRWALR